MVFCLKESVVSGAVNGTAPEPETNAALTRKLAKAVGRWEFLPVPGFALKLALGGFGGFLLAGQRAVPAKLTDAGFRFRFATLDEALCDLTM
jgi:NAD dependent epimerase/dehydratase family enzyme